MIFDCDGVLVDSESASAEAWRAALARYDYHIDSVTFAGFVGTTDRALAEAFAAQVGAGVQEVLNAAEEEMRLIAGQGLNAFPDAVALVERLVAPRSGPVSSGGQVPIRRDGGRRRSGRAEAGS